MNITNIILLIKKYVNSFKHPNILYDYEEYLEQNEANSYEKKALVSYLLAPLFESNYIRFSNDGIARSIPRALNELGYSVDIIEFNDMNFKPNVKYDLFFCHVGGNFKNIYDKLDKDTVVICFSPGEYWQFANLQEEKRFEYLKQRHGVSLPFDRYRRDVDSEEFSYSSADGIICLGDGSIRESYSKFPVVLNLNNASYHNNHYDVSKKNHEISKNNFVFFAGGGNVHKGLDVLLDAFKNTDKNLYICTILDSKFKNLYAAELKKPNIHFMGWVNPRSNKFYKIVDNCSFIIFPSCSEGSAGSVVECMNQGLIPIVSRETRIDVSDFGIFLEECKVDEIIQVIENASNKPPRWIKEKSFLTRKAAITEYSEEAFIKNMKHNIIKIVEESTDKGE